MHRRFGSPQDTERPNFFTLFEVVLVVESTDRWSHSSSKTGRSHRIPYPPSLCHWNFERTRQCEGRGDGSPPTRCLGSSFVCSFRSTVLKRREGHRRKDKIGFTSPFSKPRLRGDLGSLESSSETKEPRLLNDTRSTCVGIAESNLREDGDLGPSILLTVLVGRGLSFCPYVSYVRRRAGSLSKEGGKRV